MTNYNMQSFRWRTPLGRCALILAALALLPFSAPLRAESEQAPAGVGGTKRDGAVGVTSPFTSSEPEIAPPATPAPAAPKPAPRTEASGVVPYIGPASPSTAIGGISSDYALDSAKPITVTRLGGLPSLLFDNKMGKWLSYTLGIGQSYDSNVFLNSLKRDDFITRISPALAFKYQNKLLDWSLGSSLDYQHYAKKTRTEDLSYGLNTNARVNLYRDFAFIDISDSYTQTSQSTAVDYRTLSSSVNVTDLNTFRVSPRLEIPLTSRIRFNPQYAYTNFWYPSHANQNRQNHSVSTDFSYELYSGLTPALGYNFVRMDGQFIKYDQHYPFFRVNYLSDRVTLSSAVGYSRLILDSGATASNAVWDASIAYRLSNMSFTLATSSDVDQSAFLDSAQPGKAPQMVTNYSLGLTREFRKMALALSIYYRDNTDSQSLNLLSRRSGVTGSLTQTLSSRLSGVLTYRLERSYQSNLNPEIRTVLYQLGYGVSYNFGNEWNASGNYSYTNSGSSDSVASTVTNYTDNKVSFAASKSF